MKILLKLNIIRIKIREISYQWMDKKVDNSKLFSSVLFSFLVSPHDSSDFDSSMMGPRP